jgi:hypothetical protein
MSIVRSEGSGGIRTFINEEDQPQIPQLNNHAFYVLTQQLTRWCAPCDSYEYLTEQATEYEFIEDCTDDIKNKEE